VRHKAKIAVNLSLGSIDCQNLGLQVLAFDPVVDKPDQATKERAGKDEAAISRDHPATAISCNRSG
jgi:hypothetical protein